MINEKSKIKEKLRKIVLNKKIMKKKYFPFRLLIITIAIFYYILYLFIINKYDLTVLCNNEKTYCGWIFQIKINKNLTEEDYNMYSVFDDVKLSNIYYVPKLLINDPMYMFKKNLFWILLLVWFIFPYYILNMVIDKLDEDFK